MQNWAVEFLGVAAKKSILINRNGSNGPPRSLQLDPDWTFIEFLSAASKRLNLIPGAKRTFNANGVEIDDCMMVVDDDRMFFSQGEPYLNPKLHRDSGDDGSLAIPIHTQHVETTIIEVGPYTVADYLGRGGFGEVKIGLNQLSGERVALKFLRKADICTVRHAERTATEVQCLSTLNHPNIIRLFERLETSKHVVLAFDLMKGNVLKYMVRKGSLPSDCALSKSQARALFLQVLSGVEHIHKNFIIHGDLKLENLLLKNDNLEVVKIADFGLSQFYRPGVPIKCDGSGTISTSAPEIFVKNAAHKSETYNLGPPLDVWSLGVVLFALINGRLPFDGPTMAGPHPSNATLKVAIMECNYSIDNKVSSDAKDLIWALLSKNPVDRPAITDIWDHRWLRPKHSSDRKEIMAKSIGGSSVIFKNFQEYCGRDVFPETDISRIEAMVSGCDAKVKKKKSISAAIEDIAHATAGLFSSENDTSHYVLRRNSRGIVSQADREGQRDGNRDSVKKHERTSLARIREEKVFCTPQKLPSFTKTSISPPGTSHTRRKSLSAEKVSSKSVLLPDLGSPPSSERLSSLKGTKEVKAQAHGHLCPLRRVSSISTDSSRSADGADKDRDRDQQRFLLAPL